MRAQDFRLKAPDPRLYLRYYAYDSSLWVLGLSSKLKVPIFDFKAQSFRLIILGYRLKAQNLELRALKLKA